MLSVTKTVEIPINTSDIFTSNKDTYYSIDCAYTFGEKPSLTFELIDENGEVLFGRYFEGNGRIEQFSIVGDVIAIMVRFLPPGPKIPHNNIVLYNTKTKEGWIADTKAENNVLLYNDDIFYRNTQDVTINRCTLMVEEPVFQEIEDYSTLVKEKFTLNDVVYRFEQDYLTVINGVIKICICYIGNPAFPNKITEVYDLDGKSSDITLPCVIHQLRIQKLYDDFHFCDDGSYYFVNISGVISMGRIDSDEIEELVLPEELKAVKQKIDRIISVFKNDSYLIMWVRFTKHSSASTFYSKLECYRSKAKSARKVVR